MYDIDIKDALYIIEICVVGLEILGKMACFIDSKKSNTYDVSFPQASISKNNSVSLNQLKGLAASQKQCLFFYFIFYLFIFFFFRTRK